MESMQYWIMTAQSRNDLTGILARFEEISRVRKLRFRRLFTRPSRKVLSISGEIRMIKPTVYPAKIEASGLLVPQAKVDGFFQRPIGSLQAFATISLYGALVAGTGGRGEQ